MKWISFDQYWPTQSAGKILLTDGKEVEMKTWSYAEGDRFDLVSSGNQATHWMPLPEPPERV